MKERNLKGRKIIFKSIVYSGGSITYIRVTILSMKEQKKALSYAQ